jgi:hypothetical protein
MRRVLQLFFFLSLDWGLADFFNQDACDYLPQYIVPSAARVSVIDEGLETLPVFLVPVRRIVDKSNVFHDTKIVNHQVVEYVGTLNAAVDSEYLSGFS